MAKTQKGERGEKSGGVSAMKESGFTVRNLRFGNGIPKVCTPLVAASAAEVIEKTKKLTGLCPDIIEWRVDTLETVGQLAPCLDLLPKVREISGEIPLLFTCRSREEGGVVGLAENRRVDLYCRAIESGCIDLADIESSSALSSLERLRRAGEDCGVRLLFSSHNFEQTPNQDEIIKTLAKAQRRGADIAKTAVTATCYRDLLTLLCALERAKRECVDIPVVAISMGRYGVASRVIGGLFGSEITFADGEGCSAPGQPAVEPLRQAMALFYGEQGYG